MCAAKMRGKNDGFGDWRGLATLRRVRESRG